VGVSPEKVVAPILPVDQLWRSAKLKREKLPQRKRPLRRELIGKRNNGNFRITNINVGQRWVGLGLHG